MKGPPPPRSLASLVGLAGCSESPTGGAQAPPAAPPAVPVGVAPPSSATSRVQVITVGNVQAYTTVGVKSQVAGQIIRVHFAEGQEVKRDQPALHHRPAPFEAALRQAQATWSRTGPAPPMEAALAQRQAEVTQALANLERDPAQTENAKVQEDATASWPRGTWWPASNTTSSARP